MQIRFDEMSLGNQKKFMHCSAFIGNPSLIIMDQTNNEIDIKSRNFFIECLKKIKSDRAIMFSSHEEAFIKMLDANRINLQ